MTLEVIMRLSALVIASALSLTLAACASTNTENPYYQASTKYKGSQPTVQQARYETQAPVPVTYQTQQASYTQVNQECLSKESNRKIVGTLAGGAIGALAGRKLAGDNKTVGTIAGAAIGGAAGYGIADKTINCDPISIPASAQTATITPAYQPAPTTQAATYQSLRDSGPGIQETVDVPGDVGTPGYYAVNGIEEPVMQAAEITPPAMQTPVAIPVTAPIKTLEADTTVHTIIPGDTVYSLARGACIKVADLKQANGINDEFYIRVGDDIQIPAGHCEK